MKESVLDKVLDEINELKLAKEILTEVYIDIGPYQDREVKDETWTRVRNFFNFDDSE
jgi:hypothetical protein